MLKVKKYSFYFISEPIKTLFILVESMYFNLSHILRCLLFYKWIIVYENCLHL